MKLYLKNQGRDVLPAVAVAVSSFLCAASPEQALAQVQSSAANSAVPENVKHLSGKEISYDTYKSYVSTGRPLNDEKRIFLLYNVGTGKFINMGSYWGTQAAFSDVPRMFWLQRRNEQEVTDLWAYQRYPETPSEDSNRGYFYHDFFNLTTMQVGNTEGGKGSNVTYNYVKVMNTDGTVKQVILKDKKFNAETFKKSLTDFSFNDAYLEAEIDMTGCLGTRVKGSDGNSSYNSETILSFGENVDKWTAGANGTGGYVDLHIYGYQFDEASVAKYGNYGVKVQCLDRYKYTSANEAGTPSNRFIRIDPSDNKLHVIVKKNQILVNGVDCMPTNAPTTEGNYESPLTPFLAQTALRVGTTQGTNQSRATYNYVRVHTTASEQTPCDTCVVVNGLYNATGGITVETQTLPKDGNLNNYTLRAELDLSDITTTVDENILSIGTDPASWNGGHNIHLYYNADSHTLKCNAANSSNASGIKTDLTEITGNVKIELSKDGLTVNGTLVDKFGADNAIIKALTDNDNVTSLKWAIAKQGNVSHAAYHYINYSYKEGKHTFPESGDVWDGTAFKKKVTEGNLGRFELYTTLDLSTCTGGKADGSDGENILSIGTDIDEWYTEGSNSSQNLHIYYNAATKKIEFDAVNSTYTGAPGKQLRYTTTLSDDQLKNVEVKLTRNGLFLNGTVVDKFDATNPVIKYLLENSDAIYVGSTQGKVRSNATYTLFQIVPVATNTQNIVRPGYVSQGTKWGGSYSGTLTNKVVEATIDLSTTGKGGNENVLSIGNNIAKWGTSSSSDCNIHFYFDGTNLIMQAVNKDSYGDGTKTIIEDVTKASTVTVKLSKDGLYVNGQQVKTTTYKGKDVDMSTFIDMLTDPYKTAQIEVGSREGDKTLPQGRSYATYKQLAVTTSGDDVTVPGNNGAAFITEVGSLNGKVLTATIDLSTCRNAKENILSIGTNIYEWQAASAYNLHFYYTRNGGALNIDATANNSGKNLSTTISGDELVIRLSADGLTLNGTSFTSNDWRFTDAIKYLFNTATNVQVGSEESQGGSYATYPNGWLTVDGTAVASAKTNAAAAQAGEASTQADTDGDAAATTALAMYQPMSNQTLDGKTKYMSNAYNINFANGDYIEADIDLKGCQTKFENVFSVGTDIASWGQNEKAHNLHIYYVGRDQATGVVSAYVAYVNKDHSDDYKRLFTITPATDGSVKMLLKLSKDGLFINNVNMYPTKDPMPTITYQEGMEGDIVRFKYNTELNMPELNSDGEYIPLLPGQEGYDKAHGINVKQTNYIYTTESRTDKTMPLFITSRFNQETSASKNEGVYFAWTPRLINNDKWGTVGLFADRALPSNDITAEEAIAYSQWYFEPVEDSSNGHTYHIYFKANNVQKQKRTGKGKFDYETQSGKFYLQASNREVFGNQLENYDGTWNDKSEDGSDYNSIEALTTLPAKADNALWKVFDIDEYHRLFGSQASEMTSMMDLSFQLRDPDFMRESEELNQWKMDDALTASANALKVRIGYDNYSKKSLDDKNYTDNEGLKTTRDNQGKVTVQASDGYEIVNQRTNNHGRYMGVDVRKGGYGKMYQDTKVYYSGWYTITVQGLSTVGAKLFAQLITKDGTAEPITAELVKPSDEELDHFNTTTPSEALWPYDYADSEFPMPMYNALVAMNDRDITPNYADHYKQQVSFYIDPDVLAAQTDKTVTVRFGIDIPQTATNSAATQADDDTSASTIDHGKIEKGDDWTVFDNFHLLFGGKSIEPNIILDEDSTNLDYIEKAMHVFDQRPMRLKRTFKGGKWNTIMLPVNLTHSVFANLFGTTAKLATLDHLTETTIEFKTLAEPKDESTVFLEAFHPYIIWVDADHEKGTQAAYTAQYYNKADGGKTFTDVKIGDNHFYSDAVNLEGKHGNSEQQYYYSFAADTKGTSPIDFDTSKAYVTGELYTYKDNHVATNNTIGLRAYGTLCKNYDLVKQSDGTSKNEILTGRPHLADAYVMASNGTMRHISATGEYGTKGLRCWFVAESLTGNTGNLSSLKVAVDGITDDTTSIDDINDDEGVLIGGRYANGVYNLGGQKVRDGVSLEGLPAGIYIVGGKKVAVE